MTRVIVLMLAAAALAACASPYQHALNSRAIERPQPPMTAADADALRPYDASPYFRDQR